MTSAVASPAFIPVADHALLVEFATEFEVAAHEQVLALDRSITTRRPADIVEAVPALINLLVVFDPVRSDHETIEATLRSLMTERPGSHAPKRRHEIAVCYHDAVAPDLAAVAANCGLSTEAVITAHLAGDYQVLMYGFAPGYAYLSGVLKQIHVPRKPSAGRNARAGSVIIAERQCLVTTLDMPTGWLIIGRSPAQILPRDPERPLLFDPGDHVSFTRIDLAALKLLERKGAT